MKTKVKVKKKTKVKVKKNGIYNAKDRKRDIRNKT